ncbi:MAG: DMT family transporter [Chlamydiales bacterium]
MTQVAITYTFLVLVWGSTWIAIKFQLGEVPPEVSIFYRFLLSSCILIFWCKYKKQSLKFNLKEHLILFSLGLFLFSANYLLIYHATSYLITGLVSVIFSMASLLNIFNNALFFREKPQNKIILASLLGFGGVISIFWSEIVNLTTESQVVLGIGLSFLGTFSFSLGNIISKKTQQKGLLLIPTTAMAMCYGTVLVFGYLLFSNIPLSWSNHPIYITSLLYSSIIGSVVAFLYYFKLVGQIGPEKAGYITVLMPIVALFISNLFEGYKWKATDLLAFTMIFSGNFLLLSRKPVRKF